MPEAALKVKLSAALLDDKRPVVKNAQDQRGERWACIKDGVVVNVIVADAEFAAKVPSGPMWDRLVRIDGAKPEPTMGWTYNHARKEFTAQAEVIEP